MNLRGPVLTLFLSLFFGVCARAAVAVLDDFEVNEGRFTSNPNTASGTSQGFIKIAPTAATADRVTTQFFTGLASQQVVLDDDTAVAGSGANLDSWRLRNLSGGGTPANNVSLTNNAADTTYVGYWIRTSSPGLEASIGIDDGLALEIGSWRPIAPDGEWHVYQWKFQDVLDWEPFAGTGQNGSLEAATVTIDSVFLRGGAGFTTGTEFDAVFFMDDVSWNATGTIPEPTGTMLLAMCGFMACNRRKRPA